MPEISPPWGVVSAEQRSRARSCGCGRTRTAPAGWPRQTVGHRPSRAGRGLPPRRRRRAQGPHNAHKRGALAGRRHAPRATHWIGRTSARYRTLDVRARSRDAPQHGGGRSTQDAPATPNSRDVDRVSGHWWAFQSLFQIAAPARRNPLGFRWEQRVNAITATNQTEPRR